jgi:photosystem II stability/assembly factor-like uncharacterized protein
MKNKIAILSFIFLAASCNPFKQPQIAGVAKSTNGGVDWQAANATKENLGSVAGVNVAKMDFDPQNREVVYVSGFNDGLYKSTDSAGTWERILSNIWVFDFAIDPFDSKIIYAGGYFGDKGSLVKTRDGGKSWEEIYSEATPQVSVRGVAINPNNTNQIVIGTSAGGVIKSNDGGLTWKLVKNFGERVNRVYWQNGQVYVLVKTKGLFKSSNLDGGEFADLTQSLTKSDNFYQNFIGINDQSFNQAYIDTLAPGLIYLTAGKGVFKTVNEGQTWQKLALPGNYDVNLPARPVTVYKQSSNIVMVGIGNVVYRSADGGTTWQTQKVNSLGFVNYILIDPQLSQIVYAGNFVSQ